MLTNKDVARKLKTTAALIELTGGNAFRARALSNAARTVERLDESVADLAAAGRLEDLRGIGSGLSAQILDLLDKGTFDLHDDLVGAIPPGLTEMLRIKGLGAKKVRTIWRSLGITTIEELEEAATIGRLVDLDGFGEKTQENVLANIRLLKRYSSRWRLDQALSETSRALEWIRSLDGVVRAELSGPLRRQLETVDRADFVVATESVETVCERLHDRWAASETYSGSTEADGTTHVDGRMENGMPARFDVVRPESFARHWWRATGSPDHVAFVEKTFGLPDQPSEEAAIYEAAEMPFIAPALREYSGEFEAAKARELPHLLTVEDLHGTIHNHSRYSDGAHSLREMSDAARSMGFSYYGACDHSRSLVIAGGLSIERVREQQEEIRLLNEAYGDDFRVFSGTESDILADGSLDYPDEVLASFDLVVASIHTRFNMSADEASDRIIRAVENSYTTILGHPTGRLLLQREGYPVHHERIIDACAAHGVAIELNANPHRLDLDWRWIRRATDRGVLISINPDAHSIDELHYMEWGVSVAQKGWLTPEQCLNARSLSDFAAWLDTRRSQQGIGQV